MLTVRDMLSRKGNEAISIHPDGTVYDALQMMAASDIGALLVLENGRLCGIFSERDYARKVALNGRSEKETRVGDVMVGRLISVTPADGAKECMRLMTDHHIRHLPVYEDGKLVGIVTIGDVVKDVIEEQKTTISHLEQYICGGYLS